MPNEPVITGVCLDEQTWLELDELALACGVETTFVVQLVDEGLIEADAAPLGGQAAAKPQGGQTAAMPQGGRTAAKPPWRFTGEALARVRRIQRLQRDFEANLQSVAVMLDLLDEIERLRARLQRAGLRD